MSFDIVGEFDIINAVLDHNVIGLNVKVDIADTV